MPGAELRVHLKIGGGAYVRERSPSHGARARRARRGTVGTDTRRPAGGSAHDPFGHLQGIAVPENGWLVALRGYQWQPLRRHSSSFMISTTS